MYQRPQLGILQHRLKEPVRRINILAGPRQVGKTTIVDSLTSSNPYSFYLSVDNPDTSGKLDYPSSIAPPTQLDSRWLSHFWNVARLRARDWSVSPQNTIGQPFVFALDEIQKIPKWSETVKGLWDQDRASGLEMHVILLGSAPLLMQKGLSESLAGRYEVITATHWSYTEMQLAFDFSLEEYIYFGGYPGSAEYIKDESRWRNYLRESLIKPNIEKDILDMVRIREPHLLKQLFELGCHYSGQELALNKMSNSLGGHVLTLADYLTLLKQVKLLAGLSKYAAQEVRKRNSVPKLQVFNTGLMSATNSYSFAEAKADRSYWGRLVESCVGAHLLNTSKEETNIYYWREGAHEVDFVITNGAKLAAIEVKSAPDPIYAKGLDEFCKLHPDAKKILVGVGGVSLAEFLSEPAEHWLD